MMDGEKTNLTLIKQETAEKKSAKTSADGGAGVHTLPLIRKFLEFHHNKAEKFSVRDLFRK